LCVELFKQFEDFKKSSIDHLQRLKDFEIEKDVFIEKIKSLEDLRNSKLPLEKSFNFDLSIDKVASVSHAMSVHRTMFIKPSMSHNHTQSTCGDKGLVIKTVILPLLVITVALVVISALIASRFILKNLGIDHMYLGKVSQVWRTKSRI
jgi:uncharacterized FlgJ-related protein